MISNEPILLFDGVCNFCNAAVNFVLDHEADHALRFAFLDSPVGRRLLERWQAEGKSSQESFAGTLVLIERGRCYTHSSGALRVAGRLRYPWRLLALLAVIPPPVRDWVYGVIAKNRYRWFGRTPQCRVLTAELAARFLN